MFRRPSHRVSIPKPAHIRSRELQRAHHAAEVRRQHPKLFHQPPE